MSNECSPGAMAAQAEEEADADGGEQAAARGAAPPPKRVRDAGARQGVGFAEEYAGHQAAPAEGGGDDRVRRAFEGLAVGHPVMLICGQSRLGIHGDAAAGLAAAKRAPAGTRVVRVRDGAVLARRLMAEKEGKDDE